MQMEYLVWSNMQQQGQEVNNYYVVGREGWKSMVVNKLMYGCGALAWYQHECDDLEVRQNGMGRWLWDEGNVRNELIRGETGWSTFDDERSKGNVKMDVESGV